MDGKNFPSVRTRVDWASRLIDSMLEKGCYSERDGPCTLTASVVGATASARAFSVWGQIVPRVCRWLVISYTNFLLVLAAERETGA